LAHPIDNTLALLRDVMSEHRRALAGGLPAQASPRVALPPDRRGKLIHRLLVGVERRAGIEVSQPAAEKLLRVFASIDVAELETWISKLESLPTSSPEWSSLIESLTVHETYVMRDPSQLELFAAQLPPLIAEAAATRNHTLRFWSLGCATGEEAYSIAALVFEAMVIAGQAKKTDMGTDLLPPWKVEVVGSDISRRVLAQARVGIYDTGPLSSFRDESTVLLPYFPPVPNVSLGGRAARAVRPELKNAVRFEYFNIVDDPVPPQPFDAVFCRNVLIYFSARARQLAQERLRGAVRAGGFLLFGPTDTLIANEGFDTLWASDAVIYRQRIE
jgi:chemotaxis protein methyltransferase CheR